MNKKPPRMYYKETPIEALLILIDNNVTIKKVHLLSLLEVEKAIQAKHKEDIFKMYIKPYANEDGLIEQDMLNVLIDRYKENYEK